MDQRSKSSCFTSALFFWPSRERAGGPADSAGCFHAEWFGILWKAWCKCDRLGNDKPEILQHFLKEQQTHTDTRTVQRCDLSKWRRTTGPWVQGGRYSQSKAVFEVWRVNTMTGLSCHLLCLFSQRVTWRRGGRAYRISVWVRALVSLCLSTFSIVSLPHGWVHASQHTHGAACCNPLHPLSIQPNTRGGIHALATKETMHGAGDIVLLTRCSFKKMVESN